MIIETECFNDRNMSIMITLINSGPKMELCGTPTKITNAVYYFLVLVVVC